MYRDIDGPELERRDPKAPLLDPVNHPFIALANIVAAEIFDILGPMLWAALVVLLVVAIFSPS